MSVFLSVKIPTSTSSHPTNKTDCCLPKCTLAFWSLFSEHSCLLQPYTNYFSPLLWSALPSSLSGNPSQPHIQNGAQMFCHSTCWSPLFLPLKQDAYMFTQPLRAHYGNFIPHLKKGCDWRFTSSITRNGAIEWVWKKQCLPLLHGHSLRKTSVELLSDQQVCSPVCWI